MIDNHKAMHPRAEVLEHVTRLLGQVPGVLVHSYCLSRRVATIEFTVHLTASADALDQLALETNVSIQPPRPKNLRVLPPGSYTFIASAKRLSMIEAGELQLLGIHLVWRLHRLGLLASAEANRLLKHWRARCV